MNQRRVLRIYQIAAIALAVFCFFQTVAFPVDSTPAQMGLNQWIALLGALFCAADGFYMQKKILRGSRNPQAPSKSTPAGRWMAGNLIRIAFATSASLWGLLLHYFGSPDWLARTLIGLGLVLLLIWRPGTRPQSVEETSVAPAS